MPDAAQPDSPMWWLNRLMCRLSEKQNHYDRLDRWARGEPPLPTAPDRCDEIVRAFQRKARANWAGLIVDSVLDRMKVTGFRTGAAGDELSDAEAWRVWQANNLDADSGLVHRAKLSMGDAYVIVGDVDAATDEPLITVEDPRQVVTESDPVNKRRTVAALKVFADDAAEVDRAYLYLPGQVFKAERKRSTWQRKRGQVSYSGVNLTGSSWQFDNTDGDALATSRCPVVRFPNRADMFGCSLGEFEDVVDDLERINMMLLQRLQIAVMQAFRQRAILGELPKVDEFGNEIDYSQEFLAGPAALWKLPGDAKMWESAGVDLTPILESVKADVRDVAATTRTPMFYMFPDAANGSAEGASLQREGHIFKVADRLVESSDPWEMVMSLAFEVKGDAERASMVDMEVLWAPPERISTSEKYDAASKAAAAGVPWRSIMTDVLQFTPQQVDRMERERLQDVSTDPMAMVLGELDRGREPVPAGATPVVSDGGN